MAAAALCAACGSDKSTAPVADKLCGGGGVVTLAVNQAATIDCSAGSVVDLGGSGAHYLIVPQFASSHVANAGVGYTLAAHTLTLTADIASASVTATAPLPNGEDGLRLARAVTPFVASGETQPGARQAAFDFALRKRARDAVASGAWTRAGASRSASAPLRAVPALGSMRAFQVVSSFDTKNPTFATVNAQLTYVGANVLVYVDAQSPTNGFTPDQLTAFSKLFDETLYPIDIAAFGQPSDIDGNQRVIMLLTPIVNALVTKAECETGGYVGGFFDGFDLVSNSVNSNQGEVFYAVVPDPSASVSCAHTVAQLLDVVPATFLHELQHLISFSQHVVVNNGAAEEGWLDEGMSLVAEELGSSYYEQKYPPPSGRTNPAQLFPDSAEGFIVGLLGDSYTYLERPDTASVTLHSDADGGLAWRGGDWLLLRWLGDHESTDFYQRLEHSKATGIANISAAAGEAFPTLFGDFSLSLWADSIPGQPRSAVPARDRFTTRNLRELYQAYYNAGGGNRPYPAQVTTLTIGNTVTGKMVPGTMMFYRADATTPIRVKFAPSSGTFDSNLHPQLSIYRLPN
ncbi:MAG: hypothetical protein ACJ79K_01720 [Gemmatimonadaceae bacterium]